MNAEKEVFQDELNAEVNLAVQGKLADSNITEAHLAALRDELLPLAEVPIADEARYKLVKGGLRKINNTLGIIERICTVGRRPALLEQRAWITAQKEYTATGEEIRNPLKARIDEWEAIVDAKAAEELARWTAKINARKERMATVGFRFNPLTKEYELPGFASIDEEGVTGLNVDDLQFAEWLLDLERQMAEHKEREEEKERTAKIAADALAKEQEAKELAAKLEAQRLVDMKAEIEQREQELKEQEWRMNDRVNEARKNELMALGATLEDGRLLIRVPSHPSPLMPHTGGMVAWTIGELHESPDWTQDITMAKDWAERRDKKVAEIAEYTTKQERKQEQERATREKQLQEEAAKKAVEDERIRVATEMKARLEKEEHQAKEAAEKLAAAGDKGLVEQYIERLKDLHDTIPVLTSSIGRSAMKTLDKQLSDTKGMLTSLLKDL